MAMGDLNVESLTRILGKEVPEIHVVVAKNLTLGLDEEAVAQILGVSVEEIRELLTDDTYKEVRTLVGAEHAKTLSQKDMSWDEIESAALENLMPRVKNTKDTEVLLKIAAVANRAQRRTPSSQSGVLDPSQAGARVPLTLTRRFIERLNGAGQVSEREEVQQISVTNGTAVNPSFNDINALLNVQDHPAIPHKISFQTHDPDVTLEDLGEAFDRFNRS